MKKALTAIFGIFVFLIFVLDRMILSWTFKQLPSFTAWLENDFDYTSYQTMKSSVLRVFTFACLAVFQYFAAWWVILIFWAVVLTVLGIIGFIEIKKQKQ